MLRLLCWTMAVTAVTTELLWDTKGTNEDDRFIPKHSSQLRRFQIVHEMNQNADQTQTLHDKPPTCKITGDIADCSSRNISKIEQLSLPDNITELDLSFNNIQDIPDGALGNFTRLTLLNVSQNQIQQLNNGSFYNLTSLRCLDLHSNNLSMNNETFPEEVFKPLVSLTHLWINNNTNVNYTTLDYPDTVLSHLGNLTSLWIDGLPNKKFEAGFKSLTSLLNLTLDGTVGQGYCHMISLPADMFDNLSGLRHLVLRHCQIKGSLVNRNVFLPLTSLQSLDLGYNVGLHFQYLGDALEMIVNYTNLTKLIISDINNPYYPAICVTKEFAKSLPRRLEILDVQGNSLETLEHGVLDHLPKSLRYIYIDSNRFLFASYLKDLDKLENLEELSIATWNTFLLPKYYPPETPPEICGNISKTPNIDNNYHNAITSEKKLRMNEEEEEEDNNYYLTQALPPKLQRVMIRNAGWSNYVDEIHFNPNNSVKLIALDWNNFPKLIGPIVGLNQLENISFVGCNIIEIRYTFFQNLTSLKYVDLSSNYFGRYTFLPGTPSPLIWLKNLTYLALNFTDIQQISYDAFQGLNNLVTLLLDRNYINNFDIDLSNMTQLRYINLNKTLINSFNPETRKMLDHIHSISNLTVKFPGDMLECECSDLDFIQWMTSTSVLTTDTQYLCNTGNGVEKRVVNLLQLYKSMQRECVTNYQLLSIVISCTCLLIIMMLAAITYRFRWKLWYLYYAAVLHYTGGSNKRDCMEKFEFDVFMSYAHEDHEFVVNHLFPELTSRGLKVHIHGLHFVAGQYISSNIVNAVQSSRRTLVVLTTNHAKSKWSKFEIEMANIEQVHTGRSVLLFLIMENLPKLNSKIMFHVKSNTYVKFPDSSEDPAIMQMFWSKLVSDLRS